jgi:Zn-dependent protease with chaperone function
MIVALALAVPIVIIAPHLVPQSRLTPRNGIALWLSVLGLRAALALSLAMIALLYLPATDLFVLLTHWCVHGVVPFLTTHLGLDGHRFGDAAVLAPALVIAGFLLSATFGVWRATRAARAWLRSNALGDGPRQSVIVGGSDVLVAAAGLRSPRVVVSAGALVSLDDSELAAGLEHEWGHIAHGHRFFALFGHFLCCFSRFLPGGRHALESLHFQLERDADEYAVRRTGDSLALASAISKVATAGRLSGEPALASLGGGGVPERLRLLVRGRDGTGRLAGISARMLGLAAVILTVAILVSLPGVAAAGAGEVRSGPAQDYDCPE